MTFKEWHLVCVTCPTKATVLCWDYDIPRKCPECSDDMVLDDAPKRTLMIATDDIPGGIEIRHGICNPDGSPKRYYSKTDIKRAADRAGVTIDGDTPKKYFGGREI